MIREFLKEAFTRYVQTVAMPAYLERYLRSQDALLDRARKEARVLVDLLVVGECLQTPGDKVTAARRVVLSLGDATGYGIRLDCERAMKNITVVVFADTRLSVEKITVGQAQISSQGCIAYHHTWQPGQTMIVRVTEAPVFR